MKQSELPTNSLLELDYDSRAAKRGASAVGGSEGVGARRLQGSEVTERELNNLKRRRLSHRSAKRNGTGGGAKPTQAATPSVGGAASDGVRGQSAHGVVGAVQLAPDSPLPRGTAQRGVVQNPVVHAHGATKIGSNTGDDPDYHVSVTHQAPRSGGAASGLKASPRANIAGLMVSGILLITGALIIGFFVWIAIDGLRGGASVSSLPPITQSQPGGDTGSFGAAPLPPTGAGFAAADLLPLEIQEAEQLLSAMGFTVGIPDTSADGVTRDAIQEFEAVMALPPSDGTLTRAILGEIRGMAVFTGAVSF